MNQILQQHTHLSFKTEIHLCDVISFLFYLQIILLFQQKAKEAPEKAEQPTETFNLGLWWRCRYVNYNFSWWQMESKLMDWNQKVSKATGIFYGVE